MGKRALITQVKHITNREGFIVDPFWGSGETPQPVLQLAAAIEEGGREKLRNALGLGVRHLTGRDASKDATEEELEAVGHALFASASTVLALVVKNGSESDNVARDLANLGIDGECAGDIVQAAARAQERVARLPAGLGPRFPSVDGVRWRVDVTISTTALSRVLKPSVQMELELSDGALERFEMTADQLQDLRYDVARAMKEMQDLEASQTVKLAAGKPHPASRATPSKAHGAPAQHAPSPAPISGHQPRAAAAAPPADLPSF